MRKYLLLISVFIIITVALILILLERAKVEAPIAKASVGNDTIRSVKEQFDSLYHQTSVCINDLYLGRSSLGPEGSKHLHAIAKLGVGVLPYIVEEMEKGDIFLTLPFFIITKKRFEKSDYSDSSKIGDAITTAKMYVQWWKEGRKEIPQRFNNLYHERNLLKQSGKIAEAEEISKKIVRLGIIILPYLVEKIAEGDTALISTVSTLTDGEIKEDVKPEECVKWWQQNKEKWYIPIEDEPKEE